MQAKIACTQKLLYIHELFINKQLYWNVLFKKEGNKMVAMQANKQLDTKKTFEIIYTNIVNEVAQALSDFKTNHNTGVYDFKW